jgi:hypothetical protein
MRFWNHKIWTPRHIQAISWLIDPYKFIIWKSWNKLTCLMTWLKDSCSLPWRCASFLKSLLCSCIGISTLYTLLNASYIPAWNIQHVLHYNQPKILMTLINAFQFIFLRLLIMHVIKNYGVMICSVKLHTDSHTIKIIW